MFSVSEGTETGTLSISIGIPALLFPTRVFIFSSLFITLEVYSVNTNLESLAISSFFTARATYDLLSSTRAIFSVAFKRRVSVV